MRRALLALAILATVACGGATHVHTPPPQEEVRFLHPRARVAIGHPYGVEVPLQAWIARHPENRWFELQWGPEGQEPSVHGKSVDGEAEAPVFPAERWLTVRVGCGRQVLTALACTAHERARCTRWRARASTTLDVQCSGGAQ